MSKAALIQLNPPGTGHSLVRLSRTGLSHSAGQATCRLQTMSFFGPRHRFGQRPVESEDRVSGRFHDYASAAARFER
eukprot:3934635-Prymnesium_polylepis.3